MELSGCYVKKMNKNYELLSSIKVKGVGLFIPTYDKEEA